MSSMKVNSDNIREYHLEKDPITSKGGLGSNMSWDDPGAARLGLTGKFSEGDFAKMGNLALGKSPDGGQQLCGRDGGKFPHTRYAGTDTILSEDKSFGVVAMEDPAARKVLEEAMLKVAAGMNRNIQGRVTKDGVTTRVPAEGVGLNVLHSISRAADTHPHLHAIKFNIVFIPSGKKGKGKWGTMENYSLLKTQTPTKQELHNECARAYQNIGYRVDCKPSSNGRLNVPYVVGISRDICDTFSKRSHQIKGSHELRASLTKSHPGASPAKIDGYIQAATKPDKDPDLTERRLIESHRQQSAEKGIDQREMVLAAKALGGLEPEPRRPAAELLNNALETLLKKTPMVKADSLIGQTMKVGCCHVIASEVEDAFKAAVDSGKVIDLGKGLLSTPARIEAEKEKGNDLQKLADAANTPRPARTWKEAKNSAKVADQEGKESASLDGPAVNPENCAAKYQDAAKDRLQEGKEQDMSARGNTKPQTAIESILNPRPLSVIETILSEAKNTTKETGNNSAKDSDKTADKDARKKERGDNDQEKDGATKSAKKSSKGMDI